MAATRFPKILHRLATLRFRNIATGILALALSSAALASGSLRCGARIVDEEDLAAELLAICGEPSYRDQLLVQTPNGAHIADTEIWTYDFGPQKLLQLVTLRNGQISNIESDGYGFSPNSTPRCEPRTVVEGLSKYRLVAQCGEPLTKRSEQALRSLHSQPEIYRGNGDPYAYRNQYFTPVYREEWVYNFGSRSPMRRVILEDGRVTYVETIDRGFDR